VPDYKLEQLSPRSFEHLIQALVLKYLGPHLTVFGDGPDGGREATFAGSVNYPDSTSGWKGDGVIQVKFRQVPETRESDASWLIERVQKDLGNRRRVGDLLYRLDGGGYPVDAPQFYLLVSNVTLSSVAATGGKDRVIARLREHQKRLGWTAFDLWDGDKIGRLLDDSVEITS